MATVALQVVLPFSFPLSSQSDPSKMHICSCDCLFKILKQHLFSFKNVPNSYPWVERPFLWLSASISPSFLPISRPPTQVPKSGSCSHAESGSLPSLPVSPAITPMHLLAPTGLSSRVLVVPSPGKPSLLALCLPLSYSHCSSSGAGLSYLLSLQDRV